ncbi:uncharacterized protein LOC132701291 [Cylas formicarius]|uniref:uncharacterized protein LOC132701291 n=1 Tax=Cylas formicarius TaxID=197179 RepID=UPI0029584D55|nr:uncharacterized protein LOC132701291 [Cylas formicarius]
MSNTSNSVVDTLLKKNILQCGLCKKLLLSTPVMLVEEVGNTCISCFRENFINSKSLQNTAIEELVSSLNYPCRYRENGCEYYCSSSDLLYHEDICIFRSKRCPMWSVCNCTWEGFLTEFVGHFLNYHGEHVIKFDCNLFYLDVSMAEEEVIKLLVTKNIILLLKMQLSIEKNKLYYVVCHVKDDGTTYDYSVKHKGNSDSYIKTRSTVVESKYIYRDLDESIAVSVDLLSLQQTVKVANRITNIFKIKTFDAPAHYLEERMLQFFECPVCKSFMKPPIYQCQSGHSICNSCKPRLEKCPTCRAPFGMTRNYSLEGLTVGVSYPCTFHDLGCMMSLSPADIAKHEAVCPYKPYNCPVHLCTMTGSQDVIVTHLQEFHSEHVIFEGYTETFRLEAYHPLNQIVDRKILLAYDHIFRLTCRRWGDSYMWASEIIGVQNDTKSFVYEVSIIDIKKPEKRLIRTDYCLKEMIEDELLKKCVALPNRILSSYSNNGMVQFHFRVKKGM